MWYCIYFIPLLTTNLIIPIDSKSVLVQKLITLIKYVIKYMYLFYKIFYKTNAMFPVKINSTMYLLLLIVK